MSDSIEFGRPRTSRGRRLVGLAAATLLVAGTLATVERAEPSNHQAQARSADANVHFRFGPGNKDLVFSPEGSRLVVNTGSVGFSIVSHEPVQVSFGGLHCVARKLHGDMFAAPADGSTLIFGDVVIPESSLGAECQNGNVLPAAQVGQLLIADKAYPYTISH